MSRVKLIFSMSARNLRRQWRRNSILLFAITVAIGGVIVLNSFVRGMQVQMVDTVVDNLSGHIKLHAHGYRDDPTVERGFSIGTDDVDFALKDLPVMGWATRLTVPSVVMSERETRGAQLVGIDPDREIISFISSATLEGTQLADVHDSQILIGRALLDDLQTKLGRRIVVITQDSDGISKEIGYTIAGVYDAQSESAERTFVFTGLEALQGLLATNQVTELSIRFRTRYVDQADYTIVQSAFSEFDVLSWQQSNPLVAFLYETVDVVIYIWLGIVLGALVFGLVNTLITAVLERTQEFGLFRAVGMRPTVIVSQVVLESVILMVIGIALGLVGSLAVFTWLSEGIDLSAFASGVDMMGMSPRINPAALPRDIAIVILISLVLSIVASFFPAIRAVRMNPLEALRD